MYKIQYKIYGKVCIFSLNRENELTLEIFFCIIHLYAAICMQRCVSMAIKENVKKYATEFRLHWSRPPFRKYVSYKETVFYGLGGMGVQLVVAFTGQIGLSATSFLVGSTIGIQPMHLQYMAIISTILGFGITALRSWLIDNVRFKSGKFRPWLMSLGIPSVLISILFVYMPYEQMEYAQKVFWVLILYNLLQCFMPFYQQAYTDLAQVISPDTQERTDVIAVSSILYSFAPTITGLVVPYLSNYTGGLDNIQTYRILHPALAIFGLVFSYFASLGTKERIVEAETHIRPGINFLDAFRTVSRNKYFWVTSLAGWMGFLEGAFGVIIGWMFIYGRPDQMGIYGIAQTLVGNAALWAMMFCPLIIRAIGKRNLLIWCNLANVVILTGLLFTYENLYLLIVFFYLNGFANSLSIVYTPGINADIRDYQHYLTGERIDGMFGAIGLIGSFIGMFTGLVQPALYEMAGLKNDYYVMYDEAVRDNLFHILIIASIIGAVMNVIPYFFYDLTEQKQRNISKVLRIRALFEDYGNGVLSDETLVDTIDLVEEIREYSQMEKRDVSKTAIEEAKNIADKNERKAAVKAAKKQRRENKKINNEIEEAYIVMDEMSRFETKRMQDQVAYAHTIAAQGLQSAFKYSPDMLKEAKKMPHADKEEKIHRRDVMDVLYAWKRANKVAVKAYPNGVIVKPDEDKMNEALKMPEETTAQSRAKKKLIKKYTKELTNYHRAAKPYLDAERLILQKENYTHYDEIFAKYEKAKIHVEQKREEDRIAHEKLEAEKLADMERLKQEKFEKKSPKRQAKILEKREKAAAKQAAKEAKKKEKETVTK